MSFDISFMQSVLQIIDSIFYPNLNNTSAQILLQSEFIKYRLQILEIFIVQLEIDLSLMALPEKLCFSLNGTRN